MTNLNLNNDPLSQLMQKAKLEMPFSDFEETVMHRIRKESDRRQVASHDRKLSMFFFILGTAFGILINFLLQHSPVSVLDLSPGTTMLIFQAGFVLLFLVQLEKNIPLIRQWKKQGP